jgi:hypothetical protein
MITHDIVCVHLSMCVNGTFSNLQVYTYQIKKIQHNLINLGVQDQVEKNNQLPYM